MSNRACPQVLGIDEHFFTRKRGFATTLVDLHRNKVFDVRLGRSEASLHSYLRRLPGKDNVRLIVMDLSETYRNIARQYFPRATIVTDRFHVIRPVNQHFLKAAGHSFRGSQEPRTAELDAPSRMAPETRATREPATVPG
ncbi:MAG: transposase [Halioglobus sp.]